MAVLMPGEVRSYGGGDKRKGVRVEPDQNRTTKTDQWDDTQNSKNNFLAHRYTQKTITQTENKNKGDLTQEETRQTQQQMEDTDPGTPVEHHLNPHTDCTQWPADPLAMAQPAGRMDLH